MTFEELKKLANEITDNEQAITQVSNFLLQFEEFRVQLYTLREKLTANTDMTVCLSEETQQKIQALHVLKQDIINIYNNFSKKIKERPEISNIITEIKNYNVSELNVWPIAAIQEIIALAEDTHIDEPDIAKAFRDFLQQKYQRPLLELLTTKDKNGQELKFLNPTIANNNVHLLVLLSQYHQQATECVLTDNKNILFSKINDLYDQLSRKYPHMLEAYKILKETVDALLEKNKVNLNNTCRNKLKQFLADDNTDQYIENLKNVVEQQKNSLVENNAKDEQTLVKQQQSLVEYQNIAKENITQLKEIEKESCAGILNSTLNTGDITNDLDNIDISQKINQVRNKRSKHISQETLDKLEDTYKQLKIIQTQAKPIDKITFYNIFCIIFDNTEQIPQSIEKDWKIFKQSITSQQCSLENMLGRLVKIKEKIQNQIRTIQNQIQLLNPGQQPNNLIQPNEDIQEQPQPQEQPRQQKQPEGKKQPKGKKQPEGQEQKEQEQQQKQGQKQPQTQEQQKREEQQEELKQLQNLAAKLDQVQDAVKNETNALTYPEMIEQCLQVYESAPQNIKSELEPLLHIDDYKKKVNPTLQGQERQEEQKQPGRQQEVQQRVNELSLPNQQGNNSQLITNEIREKVEQQAKKYIDSIITKINKIPNEELTKKLSPVFTIERPLQRHYQELWQTLNGVQTNNELLTELNNFNKKVVNTINRLIDTKELYDYLMYIKSQISNIKDEKLKNDIANTLTQLTQLTSDKLTIPNIESTAQDIVNALQQYIQRQIDKINNKDLKNYLQTKLPKLKELKAETILPTIRSQINIIEKISKNTDKKQAQAASDVLEQMSGDFGTIMPQQTEEELDEILKNTNKKQTQAASDVLEQMKTILKNITTLRPGEKGQEEEIKQINIKPINTVLQQLHDDLGEIAKIFHNFYSTKFAQIKQELEERQTQERSLRETMNRRPAQNESLIETRNRIQAQNESLQNIRDKIKILKTQYKECEKKRKLLQDELYQYWQTITEILTEQNYPNDKQLIQAIKNKIAELNNSNAWNDKTFINYTFNGLQIITENIEELSNAKELYDNLKDINTNIDTIKDTTLGDKLKALNIDSYNTANWGETTRYTLSGVALNFITATKTYMENKINNIKNATLKTEAEKILSPLNDFNPKLDKQWLTNTIKYIEQRITDTIKKINNTTLRTQISTLKECIMQKLDITKISSLKHLNAVKQTITPHIDAITDANLKEQIQDILKPLNNLIFNIGDMNSILKTKLPQAIKMMRNVSNTIKLVPDENEQKVLNDLKDNLKGAEQMFQVSVPQNTLDEIYPTKTLLQQISQEITAIKNEIETLPKEELQQKLQELYNNHNIDCDKYTLIKVLLEPFSSENIKINTAKAKLNQIKDILKLFSSADIDINKANEAVDKHFNLIKPIIGLPKIIDDVYTQFKKQIYSIKSIEDEINKINEQLNRDDVRNNKELSAQLRQNSKSLTQFKKELTKTTEPITSLIPELQKCEKKQNDNQIVTEISTIIKNIRTEFERDLYSIQSITDAINKINELLKRDEIQNNQDEQTKEYITQVQKTLESLSDFKQKLTEVSKLVTLDWDKIFGLQPETVNNSINFDESKPLNDAIEKCCEDHCNVLDKIKALIYKIKQIQTNTNAENETNKNKQDKTIKEIANSCNTKEGIRNLITDIIKIVSSQLMPRNNQDAAAAKQLTKIMNYLNTSQRQLSEQSWKMLSFDMNNIEQYRAGQYRKELSKQLLKYINKIHCQPCQMYNKFHTIQEKISILKAIKQDVLTPVPYAFIRKSITELIQQINKKLETKDKKTVLALLDDIMNSCEAPTTWNEIKNQIINAKSKIKALNSIGTNSTASLVSELIHKTKKYSMQQLYNETEDPQIKKILEPLDLNNANFCNLTHQQLTWRINQSLQQLQTFLNTNIIVPSSISTLTDIVKDAQLFPKKLNTQLAQLYPNKVEENNKENTQNKDIGVEENNKENAQDKDLDPKTFYLQSIKIAAKNIQHKRSNQAIYNDIRNAIARKYKNYVAKAFPSYINDYNSEIKKCQESLKKISQYTSDDKERQVFKMYYYRQMFLQQQKLAQSLDLTTFMSSCAKYLQNKQLAYSECFTDVCSAIHNAIIPPQYKKFIENSQKQWHNCPKPEQIVDLALSALNNIFNQISAIRNGLLQSNQNINIVNNTIKNIQTYYNELSNLSTQTEELKSLLTNISKEQNCNQNLKSHLHSSVLPSIDSATQLLRPLRDTTKKYLEKYTHMQKVIEYRNKISEYLEKKEQKDKDINWLLTNINPDNQNLNQQLISQNIIKPEDIIPIEEQRQLLTALNDQIKEKIKSSANSTMEECINNALKNNAVDKLNLKESLIIECPTLSQTALNNNKLSWNELKFVRCDRNGYHVSEYEKNCIQKGKTAIKLQQTTKLLNQLRTKDTFNYVADLTKETNKKKKELTDAGFWMHNTGDIAKLLETDILPLNLVEQWISQKNSFSRKILSNCWPVNHSATLEARIKQNDLMLLINKETNKCMAINPTTAFEEDGKIKQSIMENVEKVFPDGNIPEIFVPENGEYHKCMDNVGTKGIICPNIPHKWFSTTSKSMENRAKKYNKVLSGIIKNKYVNCIHSSGDSNETAAWIAKLLARNNCTIDALHLRDIEKPERLADILSIQEKSDNSNIQNIVLSYSRRYDNILANGQTIGDKKINELLSNTSHKYNWKLNLHKKDRPHDEHWSLLQSQSSIKVIRDTNILSFKSEVKTLLQRLAKQRSGDTLNICAELFSNTTKIEERDGAIYITDESSQNPYFPIVIKDNQYSWVISLNDHSLTIYYNPDGTLGIYFDRIENKCNITDTCMTYTAQNMQNRQDFEVYFPIALSIFQQVIAPTLAKFHSHNQEMLKNIRIPPLQTLPKDGKGIKYKKHKWTSLNADRHQRYNINYFPSYCRKKDTTARNNIIASNNNHMLDAQLTTNGLQLTYFDKSTGQNNVIDNNIQQKDTTACVLLTEDRDSYNNINKYTLNKYAIRDINNGSEDAISEFANNINNHNKNNSQKPIDNIKIIIDDTIVNINEIDLIFGRVREILNKIEDINKLKYITFSPQTRIIYYVEEDIKRHNKIKAKIEQLARDYKIPIYYAQPSNSEDFKAKTSLLTKYAGSVNKQKKYFRTDAQYNLKEIKIEEKRQKQGKAIQNNIEYNLGANVIDNVNQL